MHKQRWYDLDPTVSLSISLLKKASEMSQTKCAEYVINFAQENGVILKTSFNDAFNFILRRWYDNNKMLSEALAYFEQSPIELQKEIALEIIKKLQES